MTNSTLQRVWDARKAISKRCEFDSHKLVHFYQSRQENKTDRTSCSTVPSKARKRASLIR